MDKNTKIRIDHLYEDLEKYSHLYDLGGISTKQCLACTDHINARIRLEEAEFELKEAFRPSFDKALEDNDIELAKSIISKMPFTVEKAFMRDAIRQKETQNE